MIVSMLLLFEALWRLSFPALSQLMAAGEDPKPLMERGVTVVAAAGNDGEKPHSSR